MQKTVILERHWNNPNGLSTSDDSGLEIEFTSDLRPHDIGSMVVGTMPVSNWVIPMGQSSFEVTAECSAACTAARLTSPVTVVATFPHMHISGTRFKTGLYRNGVELAPIDPLQFYDFDFQVIRDSGAKELRPKDTITFSCYYNTEGRGSDVTGGESTEEEM